MHGRILVIAAVCAGACTAGGTDTARRATADSIRTDSIARARQDSINRAQPGYIVDSIFPVQEEIRRFRAAIGGTAVTALQGGATTREELIRRFVRAVAGADTTALRAMVVQVREFADLYYLDSPYARPPWRQPPGLAWSMIVTPSAEGLTAVLRRLGGQPLEYVSHACDAATTEGAVRRHSGCVVTTRDAAGVVATSRLFGSIIERAGAYKFLSYTNQF
jgi:hypothetical protein